MITDFQLIVIVIAVGFIYVITLIFPKRASFANSELREFFKIFPLSQLFKRDSKKKEDDDEEEKEFEEKKDDD